MSDIAAAAGMSRPTLYAAFENKVAVLDAVLALHAAEHEAGAARRLAGVEGLEARLRVLFAEFIVEPYATTFGSEGSRDLVANIGSYAPDGVAALYARFEALLAAELAAAGQAPQRAADAARILALATRGLKASGVPLAELERLVAGLIGMAIAAG